MEEVKVDVVQAANNRVKALAAEREELIKTANTLADQRAQVINRIVGIEGALQEISLLIDRKSVV